MQRGQLLSIMVVFDENKEARTMDMPTRLPVIAPILSFCTVDISSAPWTSGGGAGMLTVVLQDGLSKFLEFHCRECVDA